MAQPAIQLTGLHAEIDPAALARKQVRVQITGGVLRLSDRGAAIALAPLGVAVERISHGRLFLVTRQRVPVFGLVDIHLELRPSIGPRGRLVLELINFRAGILAVPPFVVSGIIAGLARGKPGIHISEDNQIQVDLAEILTPLGIALPAPRALGADGGILEIAF